MFCKSGILTFIFAKNNNFVRQYLYTHHVNENTFAPSELWSPCLFFFSLSLSCLSFSGWFPGAQRLSEFTFLPGLLRYSREGTLHLHPMERAPEAFVNRAIPMHGLYWLLHKPRNISLFLSPLLSYHSTLDHQVPVH